MENRHVESALALLKNLHYVSIATVCEDGKPWNSPVSATLNSDLSVRWGSAPVNVHSQNITRDGRVFVVVFDTNAPEGTGEGLYMEGTASLLRHLSEDIAEYQFVPQRVWINDEVKHEDGSYRHDIRVEIDLATLKNAFAS